MRSRMRCCSWRAPTPTVRREEWKPLFYRILENRIRDMQRRRTVRGPRHGLAARSRGEDDEEEADPIAQAPSPEPQPVRRLELDEAMGALEQALERLPRRQQQAFLLRTLEGLDVAETAQAMGCSEGSVKTHYFPRTAGTARATRRALHMSRRG